MLGFGRNYLVVIVTYLILHLELQSSKITIYFYHTLLWQLQQKQLGTNSSHVHDRTIIINYINVMLQCNVIPIRSS